MSLNSRAPGAWLLIAAAAILAPCGPLAQESGPRKILSAALATDYRINGLSQTDTGASLRFSFDYQSGSGAFAGANLGNAEFASEYFVPEPRDIQANVYGGYVWRGDDWSANISASRYLYPDTTYDYDYSLVSINADFRSRYFVAVSHSSDHLSLGYSARTAELGIAWPWIRDMEISASAGRYSAQDAQGTSYSYRDIGLSRVFGNFSVDLRYHDNTFDRVSLLGNGESDAWVLTVAHAILPRRPASRR